MSAIDLALEFLTTVIGFSLAFVYLRVPGWSIYPQEVTSLAGIICLAAALVATAVFLSDAIAIMRGGE